MAVFIGTTGDTKYSVYNNKKKLKSLSSLSEARKWAKKEIMKGYYALEIKRNGKIVDVVFY
jgi:septal ring-binding cell division protein DamX